MKALKDKTGSGSADRIGGIGLVKTGSLTGSDRFKSDLRCLMFCRACTFWEWLINMEGSWWKDKDDNLAKNTTNVVYKEINWGEVPGYSLLGGEGQEFDSWLEHSWGIFPWKVNRVRGPTDAQTSHSWEQRLGSPVSTYRCLASPEQVKRYIKRIKVVMSYAMYINMKKQMTIDGFLKRKYTSSSQNSEIPLEIILDENTHVPNIPVMENQSKKAHVETDEVDLNTLERDPGLRMQIFDYPVNQRDTVMENQSKKAHTYSSGFHCYNREKFNDHEDEEES
ncbi:hypothetical protein LXL04_037125 [Taraxacum kok-saghyz]